MLCGLAAAAMLAPTGPLVGQTALPAPQPWQPFRTERAGASPPPDALAEAPPLRAALLPTDGAAMFPQPAFAAPGCEMPCYGDSAPFPFSAVPGMSYVDVPVAPPTSPDFWFWRVLPEGVIWQSYWAGVHEPRLSGVAFHDGNGGGNFLDGSVGGRAALLRYGTESVGRPQGAELQIEGAAFPRLNLDEDWDLDATDFRVGFPLVYGRDNWQAKFSYYHLSSHMGDEFAIREMALAERINYSRDSLTLALSYFPLPAVRLYAEMDWAFHYDVSEPWAFQFGVDVAQPGPTGPWGTPFLAINGHIREEVDYGGNVVAQAGWLWRGNSSQTFRAGFHYYNGKSSQFEFFDHFEEQIGGGLWYDF